MQIFSDDDEDANLLVPLAFAAKSKPTPARHHHADLAPSHSGVDAAFGSNNTDDFTLPAQEISCYQSVVPLPGCSGQTELGSQAMSAPKYVVPQDPVQPLLEIIMNDPVYAHKV